MKKTLFIITSLLLLSTGIMLLLYPNISNWLAERNYSKAIQEYREDVSNALPAALQAEREKAALYNKSLGYTNGSTHLLNLENMDMPSDYFTTLNTKGVMGYINIPAINVSLPIYHGTGNDVLLKGVGHMANTALPIGGMGNHSVLTGHSGLPSAKLFNDLEQLKVEDVFYLHILDETLAYIVDNISVIEPTNIDFLIPYPDRDWVSLMTCTPYGINSHRLVVRGSRIPYIEGDEEMLIDIAPHSPESWTYIVITFIVCVIVLIYFISKWYIMYNPNKNQLWFLATLLLIMGISMIAYPPISQYLFREGVKQINADYLKRMDSLRDSMLDRFYEQMVKYNEGLFEERQITLSDSVSYQEADIALKEFGYDEDMIGYLRINKINVELPIYLGANKVNMKQGAAHLTNTSLPVGGINTNAVIAAHRGLGTLPMFKDIESLEIEDEIIIVNFREELSYQVTQIKIINPTDKESILIQPDRDMITLLTCHPYGYNYQRYAVYCDRRL